MQYDLTNARLWFRDTIPTTHPEFVKLLIDLQTGTGNYIYAEPTIINCP
jgi:hypothetical protein